MIKLKTGVFIFFSTGCIVMGAVLATIFLSLDGNKKPDGYSQVASTGSCSFSRINNQDYKYVKPIMLIEKDCEGSELQYIKNDLTTAIEGDKQMGLVSQASVILFDMNHSDWIGVNQDEGYSPGSLIKVPLMISLFKMVEKKTLSLDTKIKFDRPVGNPHQTYNDKQIVMGNSYSVAELIHYMISYSDNQATSILHDVVDLQIYAKTFTDLGLAKPDFNDPKYTITPKEYSRFIRVLYNGSYIGRNHSEQALLYMAESSFKDGIESSIDNKNTFIAHKFGESFVNGKHELHESAVVYSNGAAYVLTIMTMGDKVDALTHVIQQLSKTVFENMNKRKSNTVG